MPNTPDLGGILGRGPNNLNWRALTAFRGNQFPLLVSTLLFFQSLSTGRGQKWGWECRLKSTSIASIHHSRPVHRTHYCRCCTNRFVNLLLLLPFLLNKTLRYLNYTWQLISNSKWVLHPFPVEYYGLRLLGANSHSSHSQFDFCILV